MQERRNPQADINAALQESCDAVYQTANREIANLSKEIKLFRVTKDLKTYDEPRTVKGNNGDLWVVQNHPLYPDSAIFTKPGEPKYEIRVDRRNDINTFTHHGSPQDRAAGKVGTDGTAVVKMLGPNSYDHVKVDDLIDREVSLVKAAKLLIPENSPLQDKLDEHLTAIVKTIRKECDFYDSKHLARDGGGDFEKKHEIFKKEILGASVRELCAAINASRDNTGSVDDIAKELQKREIAMLNDNGRPLIIKSKEIEKKQVVSLQMPLGQKTIVSGDRSGMDKDVKLSNHVRDATAFIDGQGKMKIAYSVDGHSSYSPIDEKNETRRQNIAKDAAVEKAQQLILDQFGGDKGKLRAAIARREPIVLSIAAMTMLTPTKFAVGEKAYRGKESENSQYTETESALAYLAQQKLINIPGVGRVPVEVDTMSVNIPVNVKGKKQEILRSPLQEENNKKGMEIFAGKVARYDAENRLDWRKLAKSSATNISGLESIANIFDDIQKTSNHDILKNKFGSDRLGDAVALMQQFLDDNQNNKNISQADRKNIINRIYMIQALDYFYNEKYLQPGQTYQFHVNFVLAAQKLGCMTEAFCKSAEDRTGWLRINMMANTIFTEIYGRPPNMQSPNDIEKFKPLMKQCFEASASLENTKYNSEARGLQSGESYIFVGKPHASTAKSCFKETLASKLFGKLSGRRSPSAPNVSSARDSGSEERVLAHTQSDPLPSNTARNIESERDRRTHLQSSYESAAARARSSSPHTTPTVEKKKDNSINKASTETDEAVTSSRSPNIGGGKF